MYFGRLLLLLMIHPAASANDFFRQLNKLVNDVHCRGGIAVYTAIKMLEFWPEVSPKCSITPADYTQAWTIIEAGWVNAQNYKKIEFHPLPQSIRTCACAVFEKAASIIELATKESLNCNHYDSQFKDMALEVSNTLRAIGKDIKEAVDHLPSRPRSSALQSRPFPDCKNLAHCLKNDDCGSMGGLCHGALAAGFCRCIDCVSTVPCYSDISCGGLAGACFFGTCHCEPAIAAQGGWHKLCGTRRYDCAGLERTYGICVC